MSKREILLADSDSIGRKQLADSFSEAGYEVETTDSTAHVFCSVLEKQIPVVLLGSGCDKKIAMANLVPLLKKCNRRVTIILVSDEEPLPTIQTVRQEGIFYHALKPTGRDDTEEILTAVECAFKKSEKDERKLSSRPAGKQESLHGAAVPYMAAQVTKQATEELPEKIRTNPTREPVRGEKKISAKATVILTALTAAVVGFVFCALTAARGMKESGGLMFWGFLGFCALIIVGQLFPAYFSFMSAKKVAEQRLREELALRSDTQRTQAVFDKNE